MTDALARLLAERAVAIVRSSELTVAVALEIVETLLAEAIGAVEFTLDSSGRARCDRRDGRPLRRATP